MSGSRMTFGTVFYVSYDVSHEIFCSGGMIIRWIHLEQLAPVASGGLRKMVDKAFLEHENPSESVGNVLWDWVMHRRDDRNRF